MIGKMYLIKERSGSHTVNVGSRDTYLSALLECVELKKKYRSSEFFVKKREEDVNDA